MYALVEDNNITKIITNPKSMVIGDVNYPAKIFSVWSQSELNAIGIYEIVFDNLNKKDEEYYTNTNQSFNYVNGEVTASYGAATPKQLEDSFWTQEDSDNKNLPKDKEVGDVKVNGLKSLKIKNIKQQASGLLDKTDWHNHKALDDNTYTIPDNIKTYRANVRTKSNEMENQINACTNVNELKALYEYTQQEDGTQTRPLAEFPKEI